MLKLVFNIRRRSDIEPEEFYRYWKDEHGPLVRSVAEVLGIRRYVQSHTIDTPINDALRASRNTEPRYDGVAELWWDSVDDFVGGWPTPPPRRRPRRSSRTRASSSTSRPRASSSPRSTRSSPLPSTQA